MNTRLFVFGIVLMFAAAVHASTDFSLDDQFGRAHTRSSVFREDVVVIIAGSQRKTPEAMQEWERALRSRVPDGVRIYGLSNLKKIPFFVPKGSVKRTLAEKLPDTSVLLDWKGKVYPSLGFADGATIAVGVFSAAGERLGDVSGELSQTKLEAVLALASP